MPDLTISTPQLIRLAPLLADILTLSPPPTPKGRYCLQKAAGQCEKPFAAYVAEERAHIDRVGVKGEDGKVKFTATSSGIGYDIIPDLHEEHAAAIAALRAPAVTLAGCRMITHAELGSCPITGEHEKILIECGLLEDAEPA